jgi:DNA-binding MarR family transcriptional regulator
MSDVSDHQAIETPERAASITDIDEAHMDAWKAFLRAQSGVLATLEDELQRERGLSLTAYEVLLHLSRAPAGALRMQELAHRAVLSKSGLTRLIDRMEKAGSVTRRACPSDRRGTFAVITEAGREMQALAAPIHLRGVREHFASRLSDQDALAIRAALSKLIPAAADPR